MNEIILSEIKKRSRFPIISEENKKDIMNKKKDSKYFWLVDPLDGTKDFIAKTGEFTINIALIEKNEPILGIIYAPALDELYVAEKHKGAYFIKNNLKKKLSSIIKLKTPISAVSSRFHGSNQMKFFLENNNILKIKQMGSALKFGRLARGDFTIYPRFVGSSEWDIAAGFIILKETNGTIIDLETKEILKFNKLNFRNGSFAALKDANDFNKFVYN